MHLLPGVEAPARVPRHTPSHAEIGQHQIRPQELPVDLAG